MPTTTAIAVTLRAALTRYAVEAAMPVETMEQFEQRERAWLILKEANEMLRVYIEAKQEAAELRPLYNRTETEHAESQRRFKLSAKYVWQPVPRKDAFLKLLQNVDTWVVQASAWPPEHHQEDGLEYTHFLSARDGIREGFMLYQEQFDLTPLEVLTGWADVTIQAEVSANPGSLDHQLIREIEYHREHVAIDPDAWWWYLDKLPR